MFNITKIFKQRTIATLILLCLISAYVPIFEKLFLEWKREEYSHGFLVPFLALLMGWHRLSGAKYTPRPSMWGLVWIAGSSLLLLASLYSTFRQLGFFSIVSTTVGLSFIFLGKDATKKISPVFVLLLLAMPLPFMIHNSLSLHLKSISSDLGVFLLQIIGVSVYQEGNIIDLGEYKLQVVDACNGLRYLFPAICFSYLIAYLFKGAMWKRLVIFLSAVPITIGMNSVRIAIVGLTVNIWGTKVADGFVHAFEGYVVFAVCVIVLIGEALLLIKTERNGKFDWDLFSIPDKKISFCFLPGGVLSYTLVAISLITMIFATSNPLSYWHDKDIPEPDLVSFPLYGENWTGISKNVDSDVLSDLTLSDYLLVDYKNQVSTDKNVNLYIAYYTHQEVGSAVHSPMTCVPGSGWKISLFEEITLDNVPYREKPLRVARMIISLGKARQLIYFWFDEREKVITNQFAAKWHLMIDSLIKGRSDGALIRVTTVIGEDEDETQADNRLVKFLQEFSPKIIQRFEKK